MAEHTKGPWQVNGKLPYIVAITEPPYQLRGTTIVSRGIETGGQDWPAISREEREANARLIAAAPDLLDACKEMLVWLRDNDEGNVGPAVRAEVAIAKAEKGG